MYVRTMVCVSFVFQQLTGDKGNNHTKNKPSESEIEATSSNRRGDCALYDIIKRELH